jgi:hypothetical protein
MLPVVLLQRVIPLATDRCDGSPPHPLMDRPTEYATGQHKKERNIDKDFLGRNRNWGKRNKRRRNDRKQKCENKRQQKRRERGLKVKII